ncbi:DeoR family transcriptional regulator [Candidatus Enterovibrio altilux]|uniref:DeoR family transcriptional regulator n=1 Tax=Candidatus Enterovibrio altilux TaxID=1927128 RepID=UPI001CC24BC3|nr:DeoR family transcriptional regulator [Candidatus Enterovibrio luxaltus]
MTKACVNTDDLVVHFDVSPPTIRRNLNKLAEEHETCRQYGGATISFGSVNVAYNTHKVMQQEAKNKLAYALLHHQNPRTVTNSLNAASILIAGKNFLSS